MSSEAEREREILTFSADEFGCVNLSLYGYCHNFLGNNGRFQPRDEMCNIYLMFYTNASTSTDGRQFFDCQGNNFPELVPKIPSTLNIDMDHSIEVDGEIADRGLNGGSRGMLENPVENGADRPYGRFSHRFIDQRNDAWGSQFEDQTPDDDDYQQVMRGRNRDRHRFRSEEFGVNPGAETDAFTDRQSGGNSQTVSETVSSTEANQVSSGASITTLAVNGGLSTPTIPVTPATTNTATAGNPPVQNSELLRKFTRRHHRHAKPAL